MRQLWRHEGWRTVWRILGVLFLLALVLVVKVTYTARQEFTRGQAASRNGAYREAITHYERAIQWYIPWSGTVRGAVERLWDIGTMAEQQADRKLALEAYQALRSSLYAIRSVYLPYPGWIARSEAKIATLMAQSRQKDDPNAAKLARDTARYTRMFQRDTAPTWGGAILVELGFFGWMGTVIGLIWQVFPRRGKGAWRRGLLWGSGMVVFLAVWIVGMLLA